MTNTSLLESYIEKSGYKRSFIARQIGLKSTYGFSRKVNNESEFTATEVAILCNLLKITAKDKNAIFFTL